MGGRGPNQTRPDRIETFSRFFLCVFAGLVSDVRKSKIHMIIFRLCILFTVAKEVVFYRIKYDGFFLCVFAGWPKRVEKDPKNAAGGHLRCSLRFLGLHSEGVWAMGEWAPTPAIMSESTEILGATLVQTSVNCTGGAARSAHPQRRNRQRASRKGASRGVPGGTWAPQGSPQGPQETPLLLNKKLGPANGRF